MTLSKKTKSELISEVKKLQKKVELLEKSERKNSERKSAERILESEPKYTRLLIDSSLDMICASDREGFIIEFNVAAQKTFGYKPEEVIGKHVSILYANPDERIRITDDEIYTKGFFSGEVTNKKKSGELFVAFLSASVLKNDEGVVLGAMGISHDISELKRAERELKESEEKYRDLFENATDLIQSVGGDGKILYVNNEWKKTLGYDDHEIENRSIFDFIHPDSIEHCQISFKKILSGESIRNMDLTFISKDGTAVICEGSVSSKLENGIVISTRGIFRNISEKQQIEKEIKQSQEKLYTQSAKFNAVIESTSHVIWAVDKKIRLTTFNKNYSNQLLKQSGIEAKIGLSMIGGDTLSSQSYDNFWIKKYESAFAGNPQYFETEFINKNGEESWREIYLNPVFNENGDVVEVSGIGHDITEKRRSEAKIRQSLQEKEVLLKEVHHRVKNNLQVISSILNLQSSYVKDEGTLSILKESQNRIKSMALIHENLYQTKDFSSINFTDYVVNLSQNLMHSYSNYDHKIKLNLDIQNVFLNLDLAIPCGLIINEIVSNALKYAFVEKKKGGEVSIKMELVGENLILLIGDNGKGLPKHIDFRNTESLGLQLVVTLTDQLSGTIELNSGKGTNYSIVFKQNQVKNRI